jgi:hypothetical protein
MTLGTNVSMKRYRDVHTDIVQQLLSGIRHVITFFNLENRQWKHIRYGSVEEELSFTSQHFKKCWNKIQAWVELKVRG